MESNVCSTDNRPAPRRLLSARVLLPLLLLGALGGCGEKDPTGIAAQRIAFNQHEALWIERGPADYSYTLGISCGECPRDLDRAVRVIVRDGSPTAVTFLDTGESVGHEGFESYDTVDDLFGVIQEAVEMNAHLLRVEYDEELGHPTAIDIDYYEEAIDDEFVIRISTLSPTP